MTEGTQTTDLNEIYKKPFLTPQDVAEILGLNLFTVYGLLKLGELRGSKLGHRTWRVKKEDLDAYVTSKEVEGGDSGGKNGLCNKS